MSGFLAGLVQRGAGLPARPAEPVAMAAHSASAPGGGSHSLDSPPQTVDASPPAPGDRAGADPATPPRAPASVTQVSQVTAVTAAPEARTPRPSASPESNFLPRAQRDLPPERIVHVPGPAPAQSVSTQAVISPVKPEDVPFQEATGSAAARSGLVALEAGPTDALEASRIDTPTRDAAGQPKVIAAASTATTPVRELPETKLTAAATVQSLVAPMARREAQAVEPPPIHVRIGKVEVRAPAPTATPAPARKPAAPVALGFAAYRRLRTYR